MKTARPHQIAAKAAVTEDFDAGHRHLIVSMATGTGKSFFFSDVYNDLISRLPGKMLVLAHTEELVDQNIAALREVHPTKKIDKEMALHKADPTTADIIVASVKSLGRKGTKRVYKYNWDEWDKIVVDEAHHTPAQSYRNILDVAGCYKPESSKLLLGVTATTQRSDGKALADYYGRISYVYSLRQAIEDGWLVDIRGYRVNTDTDLNGVGQSQGDFEIEALANKVNNPGRNEKVVSAWEKLGENRQTVVFAANVAHAQALAEEFKDRGLNFEAVWGEDPDRKQKLADHKAGKIKGLVNVGVLIEGYDDWQIACIVLACPTQSECKFTQMCGRGTRLEEGTGNLKAIHDCSLKIKDHPVKKDCIIIDVMDTTSTHSLMSVPSLMGLPDGLDLRGGSAVKTKQQLEALQEQYPNVDFKNLKCIDDANAFVEQVNMFEIRFPAEVEANSSFKWYKAADGSFGLRIPGPVISAYGDPVVRGPQGHVEISKNLLGKWEITGTIKGDKFHGERDTMEQAFTAADNAVNQRAEQLLTLINRKASWHDNPIVRTGAKAKQWNLLQKLYPGKTWPDDLTMGQASFWIDKRLARKAKR
jgi:superfamily II DNA or RNA helicase